MYTLSIEHEISDLATWRQAFERFGEARERAGVRSHRIRRAVENPQHLIIELDFDAQDGAERFRQFLHTVVWADRAASPALVGAPQTRILEGC